MKNRKVFKFNELMDPELGIQLGLQNFQKDLVNRFNYGSRRNKRDIKKP